MVSERERAQTDWHVKASVRCAVGVVGFNRTKTLIGRGVTNHISSRTFLERKTIAGDSPVRERYMTPLVILPSSSEHEKF